MNVLVIGSGGREHALITALLRSKKVKSLIASPGNAGISQLAECITIDPQEVVAYCLNHQIDFVVIGPEQPLVSGLVDSLAAKGIKAFGPNKEAAQLEASKAFTKDLCKQYNIPAAQSKNFTDATAAKAFIDTMSAPMVIKADGLAAGKGVVIAANQKEAYDAVDEMFAGKFGTAGSIVVIEEFLEGEEVSFFALCDGKHALAFGSAQDHKRVGDGDTGPNTGGMGTYSPAPIMTQAMIAKVMETIILPTVKAMNDRGTPFKGMLFAGLMIHRGIPKLLEYNTRFGDPETQVLMPRLKSDLCELLLATVDGTLDKQKVELADAAALCVVMANNGYPGSYQNGSVIGNLEQASALKDVVVFHAGTGHKDGKIVANGGRVLGVTATAPTIAEAQKKAYAAVDVINWPEGFCRRDIGYRAVNG